MSEIIGQLKKDLYYMLINMAQENKQDPRLYELKKWTIIRDWIHLLEFLWVDGMYCRWRTATGDIIIMWQANQRVSEYWEIVK